MSKLTEALEILNDHSTTQEAIRAMEKAAAYIEQKKARIEHLERVLVQARYAMQYHMDQTRPIFNTQTAIAAIDEALQIPIAKPPRSAQQ